MSKADKLISKLNNAKHGYQWSDLVALMNALGFVLREGSGSRVKFVKGTISINLHKPHPHKEMKLYAVKQVRDTLKQEGYL